CRPATGMGKRRRILVLSPLRKCGPGQGGFRGRGRKVLRRRPARRPARDRGAEGAGHEPVLPRLRVLPPLWAEANGRRIPLLRRPGGLRLTVVTRSLGIALAWWPQGRWMGSATVVRSYRVKRVA